MRYLICAPIGLLLSVCMMLCGCQDGQVKMARTFKDELARRQAQSQRSFELLRKGQAALDSGKSEKARKYLAEAVETDGRNATAWMALGTLEFEADNPPDAANAFDCAAKLEPNRYEPHYNLGIVLESAGRYTRAIDEYEAAMALAPDQVEVKENLVRCLIKNNTQPEKARRIIEQVLRLETRAEWITWLETQLRVLNREETRR